MHNLQTIETAKKAKKWLMTRTELSVDARMLKTLTSSLTS